MLNLLDNQSLIWLSSRKFFQGGKIYYYANSFSYANFSIVFRPSFGGGQKSLRRSELPQGDAPCPLVEESQLFTTALTPEQNLYIPFFKYPQILCTHFVKHIITFSKYVFMDLLYYILHFSALTLCSLLSYC